MPLKILQIPAGQMQNFTYLLYCPATRQGLAVDPSFGAPDLLAKIRQHDVELRFLVNTHGHHDHTAGNDTLLSATHAQLCGHPLDVPAAGISLTEGSCLKVGDTEVTILHTPGHTPGSITLNPPGVLVTGDTLFVGRVGRADLAGSDPVALYRSLRRLAAFPPETLIYPGHDYGAFPQSTVADENRLNPYLQCPDLESFIQLRMGG